MIEQTKTSHLGSHYTLGLDAPKTPLETMFPRIFFFQYYKNEVCLIVFLKCPKLVKEEQLKC